MSVVSRLQQLRTALHKPARRSARRHRRGRLWNRPLAQPEALEDRSLLTVIAVTSLSDGALAELAGDGQVSLREAIEAANTDSSVDGSAAGSGDDTIVFDGALAGATITLAGEQLTISDNVVITGLGPSQLTVSADVEQTSRVFQVDAGTAVTISGLTIANGSATEGGGVYNQGDLTLTDCLLTANTGEDYGGAIYNTGGHVTLKSTTLTENLTYYQGGAVWSDGTLAIAGSTFSNNYSDYLGGGIWSSGAVEALGSTFEENYAWSQGGAIQNQGSLIIGQESTFSKNSTDGYGGAISNREGGSVVIADTIFSDNHARIWGGAVESFRDIGPGRPPGLLDIVDSIFAANSSRSGAAIWNDAPAEIADCTFVENTATSFGGAIAHRLATMTITESTLADNTSGVYGGAIDSWASTVVVVRSTISETRRARMGAPWRTTSPL